MDILLFVFFSLFMSLLRKPDGNLYCGLIAGSASKTPLDVNLLKILFLDNLERGADSSGFYDGEQLWKEKGKVNKTLLPYDLMSHKSTCFIGHTRAKTMGIANKENAHPFYFKSTNHKNLEVTGAHNGTLMFWDDLRDWYRFDRSEVNMDSKIIFKALAEHNNLQVFEDLNGAAAVIFTKNDNKLYVWRNSERPLFRGYMIQNGDPKDRQMYISSLKEGLLGIGCKDVKEFKNECFYVIENGKIITNRKVLNHSLKFQELATMLRERRAEENPVQRFTQNNTSTKKKDISPKGGRVLLKDRKVNPAMDSNSKKPFEKNAFTPGLNYVRSEEEQEEVEHAGGVCAMRPAATMNSNLGFLLNGTQDNYPNVPEETQDLENDYSIEALPFELLKKSSLDFDDVVGSGMNTERLFLLSQKCWKFLDNLADSLDETTDKDMIIEKSTILEMLRESSNSIKKQLLEVLKT